MKELQSNGRNLFLVLTSAEDRSSNVKLLVLSVVGTLEYCCQIQSAPFWPTVHIVQTLTILIEPSCKKTPMLTYL